MENDIQISIRQFSETDSAVLEKLKNIPEHILYENDTAYILADRAVYTCKVTPETIALLETIRPHTPPGCAVSKREQAVLDALAGHPDPEALHRLGYKDRIQRCVILLGFSQEIRNETIRELIPLEGKDCVVFPGNREAVLLVHTEHKSREEIEEFAAAAAETVENEAGITCHAGIGRQADSLDQISKSYAEARDALSTGIRHKIPGRVFSFTGLMLERFVDAIPAEKAISLTKDIAPELYGKMMTEEILETIRVFFRNDLNLSTAARQLYIHRNTLLYRMEKIRKATGLDLRKFEDAAVFRILMCISENSDEKRN